MTRLEARAISAGYDGRIVLEEVNLVLPEGGITAIVGANASGKSTLLRVLVRLLHPRSGVVLLDGRDIQRLPTREVARRLGILPQGATAPEGLTVGQLVAQGRYPHQSWFRQWSPEDEAAIGAALSATRTVDLVDRPLDTLSGGQRQRAWLAMALAQDPEVLLLDEPTTYLDLATQLEMLDLLRDLNRRKGQTVVMVLHDVNQAARYAHHLLALLQGEVVAEGAPERVVTEDLIRAVFGLISRVVPDPVTGAPMVVPVRPARDEAAGNGPASSSRPGRGGGAGG